MKVVRRSIGCACLLTLFSIGPVCMGAQVRTDVEAQAILIGTQMRPTPGRITRRELRVVQPVVMVAVQPMRGLVARTVFNAEAISIEDGELTAGAWGEGFVDRRHPHTAFHEVMLSASTAPGCGALRCRIGGFFGKGFVPFGSDDPMSRPLAAYPVNHHLAQILERAVVGGQVVVGAVTVEGALFNGDEPERPWQWPKVSRFGDSWSGRVTIAPTAGVEIAGSMARVASPEARIGNGPSQRKYHVGARVTRTIGAASLGGLAEWAKTTEVDDAFQFTSALIEVSGSRGDHRLAIRLERTDRPEEERISDFRDARPRIDNSLVGITRWSLLTMQYRFRSGAGRLAVEPFAEATVGSIRETAGGIFDVTAIYGGAAVRRVSFGIRLGWADSGHRMGRYGVHEVHQLVGHHVPE